MNSFQHPPPPDALEAAAGAARDFLQGLATRPPGTTITQEALRARLAAPLPHHGTAPGEVIAQLARDVEGGLMGSSGPRFFGWVIGGALPAAIAADWLTSVWDQNAAIYTASPAAAMVEEVAGEWLKELLALPPTASVGFVTGCQMAHTVALAAARHSLLARRGIDAERAGLAGAPRIRVVMSEHAHESLLRALRLLGLGLDAVVRVRCTPAGPLDLDDLRRQLQAIAGEPAIVCLLAGDLNVGAFDPLRAACGIAREFGAWVHVDGAFGLWAAAHPGLRHLLDGHALADSWATDGHKWLNVPFDSGYVFIADPAAHRAVCAQDLSYGAHTSGARDPMNWNPEWSRRARGFATYAAIRSLGRAGVADLVDRCCEHAGALVDGLGRLAGVEVLARPVINQGLVRFQDPAGVDHDRFTDAVIAAVQAGGTAWFGGVTWHGMRCMRISVCNWRTTGDDVALAVEAVREAIAQAAAAAGPLRTP